MTGPTLSLDGAARRWDAVVVGAGPAGALAARALAARGLAVLLVERSAPPRWKVCGCCLNARALAVLKRAALGRLPADCGAVPLGAAQLGAAGRSALLPLPGGLALSRQAFDTALVGAAVAAGAHFLPSTRATLEGSAAPQGRAVHLHQVDAERVAGAGVVLAADGLGGQLLARAGLGAAPAEPGARIGAGVVVDSPEPFYRPGVIYLACGRGGYVGLVRLEDGWLDLAAALDADAVRAGGGPGALAARLLAEAGWPAPEGLARQPWRGTVPLTRRASRLAAERVFALGDAAGYVEPFTGEGMAWALASAEAVAPLAEAAARRWHPDLARTWAALYQRTVTSRQLPCRGAAALLRHPRLAGLAVAALRRCPLLARPFVGYLNTDHQPRTPR